MLLGIPYGDTETSSRRRGVIIGLDICLFDCQSPQSATNGRLVGYVESTQLREEFIIRQEPAWDGAADTLKQSHSLRAKAVGLRCLDTIPCNEKLVTDRTDL